MQTNTSKQTGWAEHIRQWKSSGLTQAAYCNREKLKVHQLTYQLSKLKGKANSTHPRKPSPSRFATVAMQSAPITSVLTLTFPSGIQLSGIDSSNLTVAQQLMEQIK